MSFRTETDVLTGEEARFEQIAYRNADNQRLVLDVGDKPPAGFYAFDPSTDPAPQPVPASVSRRQGRLCLLQAGKLAAVEEAIAAVADASQRLAIQIEYETDIWERENAWVEELGAQLGLSTADIDQLFITAAGL